ncbi:hypothetical protein CAPTEDRAFT_203011 [Capitella teleta]|uniref:Neurotransmitter-gated ion-channel transmembrane domain-containing protein n=1 Tax=Capitella teleta TaxID=283909 RepID=R7TUG9_CAPTE|nr:hypothetical protein CAPTEDRAFT_203011 [Capitella teleta]|eukprot:ELT95121.1 hypothetical protein CAPTEDRAFT_203011 [Capitella teleta]
MIWTNFRLGDCSANYITGTFSCKYVGLELQRELSFYLIQHYIPCILIVMLSWLSFWIDIKSVPARISLGLLTGQRHCFPKVLTMTTKSSEVASKLPKVSYVKAMDIWMTTCLAFVVGAFVEYAIVNVLLSLEERGRCLKQSEKPCSNRGLKYAAESEDVKSEYNWQAEPSREHSTAMRVEHGSKIGFPLAFVVFNIVYWASFFNDY